MKITWAENETTTDFNETNNGEVPIHNVLKDHSDLKDASDHSDHSDPTDLKDVKDLKTTKTTNQQKTANPPQAPKAPKAPNPPKAPKVVFSPSDLLNPGFEQETSSTCISLKKNGEPCGRITKLGEAYCFFHIGTCTAMTSKGLKCSNGCMEGLDRCSYHAATCPGRTKSGDPCQLAAEFCRYHRAQLDEPPSYTEVMAAIHKTQEKQEKQQCAGKTQKGHRCRLKVMDNDNEFCHFHSS